jgi:hypothetical protein
MTSSTFHKLLQGTLIAAALLLAPMYAFADYYVATTGSDTNAGTQAAPFKTLSKASSVVAAGTTVHVAPGTYAGGLQTTKSGTATSRIRFVSDTKWGAKIQGSSNEFLWDVRGNYVDIEGFEFNGANTSIVTTGLSQWFL